MSCIPPCCRTGPTVRSGRAHGEPDPTDPVHARVGGEYTLAEFDAEHFEPGGAQSAVPRADIAPGSGADR